MFALERNGVIGCQNTTRARMASGWFFTRSLSGEPTIDYDEAVEEAICFGWIDVQIRRIDDYKHMQRFTPRRQRSNWSDNNKRRALRMLREGKMTGAGRSVLSPDVLSDGRSKAETQPMTEPA